MSLLKVAIVKISHSFGGTYIIFLRKRPNQTSNIAPLNLELSDKIRQVVIK